jgi:hypothetical protein
MDWQISWINPQNEPSYRSLTLLLSGPLGVFRIEKSWPSSRAIDSDFLSLEALKEIQNIELDFASNQQSQVPVEEII